MRGRLKDIRKKSVLHAKDFDWIIPSKNLNTLIKYIYQMESVW